MHIKPQNPKIHDEAHIDIIEGRNRQFFNKETVPIFNNE